MKWDIQGNLYFSLFTLSLFTFIAKRSMTYWEIKRKAKLANRKQTKDSLRKQNRSFIDDFTSEAESIRNDDPVN